MKAKDITGKRFGRLTAVADAGRSKGGQALWRCVCTCGSECVVAGGNLRHGTTKSCGCLQREVNAKRSTKHGHKRHGKRTPTYGSWQSMKRRCLYKKNHNYKNYGGRGIKICKRWINSFESFLRDMGERPPGTTLSRKNDRGSYCKSNCKWSTPSQQAANRVNRTRLRVDGVTRTVVEWAAITKQRPTVIHARIARGWKPIECLVGRLNRKAS